MILFFERRIVSWTSQIRIYDEMGNVFCTIQGKLGWAQKFLLQDTEGRQIGEVCETTWSIPSQFRLLKGDELLASVHKKSMFRSGYSIDNGWTIEGDTKTWDWRFRKPDGSTAVRLSTSLPKLNGCFGMVIADDVDPLLAVLAVTAIESGRCTSHSREVRQELRDDRRERNRKYK